MTVLVRPGSGQRRVSATASLAHSPPLPTRSSPSSSTLTTALATHTPHPLHPIQALKVGDELKDFPDYYRVLKTQGQASTSLSKLDAAAKKALVIAFYPKASTPGCTKEMCAFRDAWRSLQDAGATVVGISGDAPEANAAFAAAQNLPFDLLSDSGNFVRKAFEIKADFLGLLPGRETIIVKKGKVVKVFNSQFGIDEHVSEALAAVKGA
jgi:thioredoxin-dependent peroxiredoxin